MFQRKSPPSSTPLIHPEEWPARSGKARVLIENPDRADLWAHADLLRRAGYDVAMCGGPTDVEGEERTVCPLVAEGHCPLVDGADVVVSTTSLADSDQIHAKLRAGAAAGLVVEGTASELGREGDAVEITLPILPAQLVDAVERARPNP